MKSNCLRQVTLRYDSAADYRTLTSGWVRTSESDSLSGLRRSRDRLPAVPLHVTSLAITASVDNRYNLELARRQWCPKAGNVFKVTAGVASHWPRGTKWMSLYCLLYFHMKRRQVTSSKLKLHW